MNGWTDGPLPQHLEQAALELFADSHPMILWSEPSMKAERHQARKAVMRMYARFLKAERWTIANAAEQLTARSCELVYGDRVIDAPTRQSVEQFAEHYLSDLARVFGGDEQADSWQHVPEDEVDDSELEVVRRVN